VAKEVGEEVIKDCIVEAMKLASMVSGEVIQLLFDTLPTAASRLGDAELLRGYLGLIRQLSAKVPRGLRPMLAHLDELFSKLTSVGCGAGRCGVRRRISATLPRSLPTTI